MTKINQKIPEGWCVKKLGECCSMYSGGTPSKNNSDFWNGDIPWVSASAMKGIYFSSSEEKITELGLQKGSNSVDKGDLLLLVRGSMLWNCIPVGIATRKLAFNQDVKGISVKKNIINLFLLYWFKTNEAFIKSMVVGTGIGAGKLDCQELNNMEIKLPPLAEQEKIAEILGTWDTAIEKLSALIEQKKLMKKALMQKLLTGQVRFSKFSDKWKKEVLRNLTIPVTTQVGKKQVITMSISAKIGFVAQSEKFGRDISGEQYSRYILLPKGAFSYNKGNSKTYPQGCAFRLKKYDEVAVPNVFISFIGKEEYIVPEFLEQFFAGNYHGKKLRKVITSSVRDNGLLNLSEDDFYKMEIYLPSSLAEQKAIADILSKADEEITLLTDQLSALQSQKKGLMQKLLTGQIRVKVA